MRVRSFIAPLVLICTLGLVACSDNGSTPGGGDTEGASTEPAGGGTMAGDDYAEALCTAVGDWQDSLETEGQAYQDALTGIANPEDIGDVKDALVTFAGNLVDETDALIDEVDSLGTPDIEDGEQVREGLISGFTSARDLFADLEEAASGLNATDPQEMVNSMQDMGQGLQEGAQELQQAFATLEDSSLADAGDEIAACQELENA
jgi:hypothetical protein